MKRIIPGILAVMLTLSIPIHADAVTSSSAVTNDEKTKKVMHVKYGDLEDLVRKNNKTIEANAKIIKSLRIRDNVEQRQQDLDDIYSDLEDLYSGLRDVSDFMGSLPSRPQPDPGEDEDGEGGGVIYPDIDAAYKTAILGLSYGLSELSNSLMTTVYDAIDFLEFDDEYVDKVELELEEINNQIVMGSQMLYIAHEYLQLQLDDLMRKQEVLDYNIFLAQKKYEVGMMTANELENAKINQVPLTSGIETLKFEMDNIKDRVSSLMDINYDLQKEFEPLPEVEEERVKMINYGTGYNLAFGNNSSLKQKRKSIDIAKIRYDDKDYADNTKSLKLNKEAAELSYEAELKNFKTAFKRVYDEVQQNARFEEEARTFYNMELENYKLTKLKYEEGLISNLALMTAKDELDIKEFELKQANVNLFNALEKYRWALDGIIAQSDNQSK